MTTDPNVVARGRVLDLLMVRLLTARSADAKRVRDDLEAVGANVRSGGWERLLDGATAAGLIDDERRPTDAGRARGLAAIGLAELPGRATWARLRDGPLMAVALGLRPGGTVPPGKSQLVALMLTRRFGADFPPGTTESAAVDRMVCRLLGFPDLADLNAVRAAVLGRLLDAPQPLPIKGAVQQFTRAALGASQGKVGQMRASTIARWVRADGDPAAEDLPAFADAATAAAAGSPTGRFGDDKVFIAPTPGGGTRPTTRPSTCRGSSGGWSTPNARGC